MNVGNLLSVRAAALDSETFDFTIRPRWLRVVYSVEPVIGLLAAVAVAPLAVAIGLAIAILSRRSPLVRHRRLGWRGEELRVLKFRTMWHASSPPGPLLAIEDLPDLKYFDKRPTDERIASRFAAWCRRYSLDELPQLVHIVSGRMSFVGPRPITRAELETFYGDCTPEVLSLRPGLTGLWQILGRNRLSYRQRRRLDLWMVRRASPRLFAVILVRTIPHVFRGSGAY
jgi:lipopolysaccharide/colanic/teichoic acid biosynthesis glycosyltransferase